MADNDEYSLADMLKILHGGEFHVDATESLRNLVRTMTNVQSTSGAIAKGALSITLKFKLDRGFMEIDANYKVTTPSVPRARSVLYPDEKGHLRRNNYQQHELPGIAAPIKTVEVPMAQERTVPDEPRATRDVIDIGRRAANDKE